MCISERFQGRIYEVCEYKTQIDFACIANLSSFEVLVRISINLHEKLTYRRSNPSRSSKIPQLYPRSRTNIS
jgi:hypothetical protein